MSKLRVMSDGVMWFDGGAMFGVVPRVLWSRYSEPDEQSRVPIDTKCLLLEVDSGYALIEAGLGTVLPKDKKCYEVKVSPGPRLPERLGEAGIDRGDIKWVIMSHLHYDHAGCIAMPDPKAPGERCVPTFPNARHVVQEGELAVAANPPPRMSASYVPALWRTVADAGLWCPVRGNAQIFDGVRVEVTGGHAPDHQVVLIERDGMKVAFMGDLIPMWLHLRPAWCCAFDSLPDETVERKAVWVDRAIDEDWTMALYHEPGPSLGTLSRNDKGRVDVEYVDAGAL